MENPAGNSQPRPNLQKSMQVLLGLFVLSAMTASGCTEIVNWVGGKSSLTLQIPPKPETSAEELMKYANCTVKAETDAQLADCRKMKDGFSAETKTHFAEIRKMKFQECVSSDLAFLNAFAEIAATLPSQKPNTVEAKYFVEKACDERVTSEENGIKAPADPKSAWALVRGTKIDLGDRAILAQYLQNGPKQLNVKSERDFFPISQAIKDGSLTCEAAMPKIDAYIQKGSIRALLFGSFCAHEKCKDSEGGAACAQSVVLAKRAAQKGDLIGQVYLAIYEMNRGATEEGLAQARKALALGEVSPIEMIPQMRDEVYKVKVNRSMALMTLASQVRYGSTSAPLKACSEAVFYEKWRFQGHELTAKKISERDWVHYVTEWSDPSSKEFQPKLVLRFACEILGDPETKKALYEKTFGERALDFCTEIKDPRFASVCSKSA